MLLNASQNGRIRKNLEASVIALQKPDLNNQVDSKKLTLFRYGVTYIFPLPICMFLLFILLVYTLYL